MSTLAITLEERIKLRMQCLDIASRYGDTPDSNIQYAKRLEKFMLELLDPEYYKKKGGE